MFSSAKCPMLAGMRLYSAAPILAETWPGEYKNALNVVSNANDGSLDEIDLGKAEQQHLLLVTVRSIVKEQNKQMQKETSNMGREEALAQHIPELKDIWWLNAVISEEKEQTNTKGEY